MKIVDHAKGPVHDGRQGLGAKGPPSIGHPNHAVVDATGNGQTRGIRFAVASHKSLENGCKSVEFIVLSTLLNDASLGSEESKT